jgi:hypothetical protein
MLILLVESFSYLEISHRLFNIQGATEKKFESGSWFVVRSSRFKVQGFNHEP